MARPRDYRAEYARRIERGKARGLSRSQARGHPRLGEPYISWRSPFQVQMHLEEGLHKMRKGTSLTRAAKSVHVSPDRLRNYLTEMGVAEKRDGRWVPGTDPRVRTVQVFSRGEPHVITVRGYDAAAQVGEYMAAVKRFLDDKALSQLEPFKGKSVTDINGRRYVFETNPNTLLRIVDTADTYEDIYDIVI